MFTRDTGLKAETLCSYESKAVLQMNFSTAISKVWKIHSLEFTPWKIQSEETMENYTNARVSPVEKRNAHSKD